ncbi:endopeptidase La [Parvicella tangerina]|uniref:Lon protease n=1 Tax=Parvicella tangerina TaxID=2829795 RepID=A0A916JMV2_9FLAO|nr:endopeptidase La [Parvicella tangerina]CAG5082581.1 Lon protease 2 [Parvicella tangerina]
MSDYLSDKSKKSIIIASGIEDGTEFIPLLSSEDEEKMNNEVLPEELAILPLRNNVLFPGVVMPITVGRDKSIKLIQDAYNNKRQIAVVSQKNGDVEEPTYNDLNEVGTVAQILKLLKMPDGTSTAIIQGKQRCKLMGLVSEEPYLLAKVATFQDTGSVEMDNRMHAIMDSIKDMALKIITESPNIPTEASFAIKNIESPTFMVNFIASHMQAEIEEKQRLLVEQDLIKRAEHLLKYLSKELQMLELKNDIQSKVKTDLDKQQREYFLHQQLKEIQNELGENPVQREITEMKARGAEKKWSAKIADVFNKELDKLGRMNPQGAEYGVQLNYLQLLLDLPWGVYTKDKFNLKKAQEILDRDHSGLEKVKERIIEYLAVLKLKGDMKSPILCLYGPPGVGKTSLGKSIAEAIGRKYVRMSLGGVHDEAEIRGHRKTYIGAMPGRVINNIKKAESDNPVFVLDEIDKLGRSNHGDPSSALLEVLDPEQNFAFNDNYVELDYDLSKVMFIATANDLSTIQPALRDRMEIIEVNGYTVEEKIEIAQKHLLPKQLNEHGMKKSDLKVPEKVLEKIIEEYTSESGVRGLEKRIAKLVRHRAKQIALEETYKKSIAIKDLLDIFGPSHAKTKYETNNVTGVVTGLAWTRVGGDILFVECSTNKGKGKLTLTGNLGDVMKESAVIALEYIKANAHHISLEDTDFENLDFHIHVPEGATPKDGPSAGVTMLTALASKLTGRKVKKYLAMTGEITLRGQVLPVGGIKEKILAAKRANIKEIILSEKNQKDVEDINPKYLEGLKFHYVKEMIEVLDIALV